MNIRYLKEYLVFAEDLSYSAASKRLYMARTSLREHIADLERELQVELVASAPSGVKLTYFGRIFEERAREIVALADETVEEFRMLKENTFCLTVSRTAISWLRNVLFEARRKVLQQNPQKRIEILTTEETGEPLQMLRGHCCDLAIARLNHHADPEILKGESDDLHLFKLCTTDILFFVNKGNPLFEKERITIGDLEEVDIVIPPDVYSSSLMGRPANSGPLGNVHFAPGVFSDYQEYYAANFTQCVGTIPRILLSHFDVDKRRDCRVFTVEDFPVRSDFYVACLEGLLQNPTARQLFDEMESIAAAEDADDGN